jgi:hypothetical protein
MNFKEISNKYPNINLKYIKYFNNIIFLMYLFSTFFWRYKLISFKLSVLEGV